MPTTNEELEHYEVGESSRKGSVKDFNDGKSNSRNGEAARLSS